MPKKNKIPVIEEITIPSGNKLPKIGIDLLGSDSPPEELLAALLKFFMELKGSAHLFLFGTQALFKGIPFPSLITPVPVSEVISMEDNPLSAIRHKKNSSLCTGIDMLKEGKLQAFISAGNTGALMAYAKMRLPDLPGIDRPALLTLLPSRQKEIAVLDVGANTSFKAEHLYQFALMGVAYQKSRGIQTPTVGLLNIGVEAKKGTPELREAYKKLEKFNKPEKNKKAVFIGNIEGRDVFQGNIDVLVTDGFTGNVFLKTAEGIAGVILGQLEETAQEECSPLLKGMLAVLRTQLHYAEYPGALLCGVDGIVMKCHGNTSSQSFAHSIVSAVRLIKHDFINQIRSHL